MLFDIITSFFVFVEHYWLQFLVRDFKKNVVYKVETDHSKPKPAMLKSERVGSDVTSFLHGNQGKCVNYLMLAAVFIRSTKHWCQFCAIKDRITAYEQKLVEMEKMTTQTSDTPHYY